jgi:hypothetical protein
MSSSLDAWPPFGVLATFFDHHVGVPMSQITKPKPKRRKTKKQTRLPHQKKQSRKGIKSKRGQPESYDELKKPVCLSLTSTAVTRLDYFSQQAGLSRSEFVERFARGELPSAMAEAIDSSTRAQT